MKNGLHKLNKKAIGLVIISMAVSAAMAMEQLEENKQQKSSLSTTQEVEMSTLDNVDANEETNEDFQEKYQYALKLMDENREQIERAKKRSRELLNIKPTKLGGYYQK